HSDSGNIDDYETCTLPTALQNRGGARMRGAWQHDGAPDIHHGGAVRAVRIESHCLHADSTLACLLQATAVPRAALPATSRR
ncbi:hypothetical protein ABXW19_11530, partial [Streptococcus suis]|uniref:hypothetical protein n=1 Tax=Streptococcus suis TaxID=1307 RepID=UPI003CF5E5D9